MSRRILRCFLPMLILALIAAFPAAPAVRSKSRTSAPAPAIDPRADQMLRQMSDYLRGLNMLTVHADTTLQMLTPSGMILNADRELDVYVQRPDHLRVNSYVPDHDRQIFYDGQSITIFSPVQNFYAVLPAPPTIQQTIDAARKRGVDLPLGDLLYDNPYNSVIKRALHGYYIGLSLVSGVKCHQLAFRGKDMDWQIWIEDSATPLPRRVVITDRLVKPWLSYMATLTKWDVSPTFGPDTFTFVPPPGATKIPFEPAMVPGVQKKHK